MTAENYLLLLEEYDYQTPPEVARDAAQAIKAASFASAVFTAFVFQPGGVAAENVYTSWAALYAALDAAAPTSANGTRSPTTIRIDDSFVTPVHPVIPAGAYNLDGVTFDGCANENADGDGAFLDIAVGATFVSGSAGLKIRFRGGVEVTYLDATPLITFNLAGKACVLDLHERAELRCSGAGAFLSAVAGQCQINANNGLIGDGVHAVFVQANAAASCQVRAYGNTTVAAAATSAAAALQLFWDSKVPGTQGANVTLTQQNGYIPATAGNWHPVPTTQSGALDQLASILQNHVQGVQAFTGPAAHAINTVALAHTTVTGHTRMFATCSWTSADADADCGMQLAIDGVGTGPNMGVSGTLAGDVMTCSIEWDFMPAAGAHNYTVLITASGAGNLTGVQSGVKVQELSG